MEPAGSRLTMPQKTKIKSPTPVVAHKHKDKRTNIPTKELRDFVAEDEAKPKTVKFPGLLYARDPSLDPQLVWKGKDEQDQQPLELPAVPIYIQEKIHPQAVIEQVRAEAKKDTPQQAEIFADFNGIKFEDLIDFYRHEQNWANRFILGDSLLVMTSLAEKEGLKGKVQCLYFDPPYGINFGSNWQVSTRKRDVKDGKAEDASRQPEQIRAFRDTWKLGIHSYLAYLRDRLTAARELLTESGSVFIQIGDENVHLVRCVLDEVFGSENFCSIITFAKTGGQAGFPLTSHHDHIIWYAKGKSTMKFRPIYAPKGNEDAGTGGYDWIEQSDGARRRLSQEERQNPKLISPQNRLFALGPLYSEGATTAGSFDIQFDNRIFQVPSGRHWKTSKEGVEKLKSANRLWSPGSDVRYVRYTQDFPCSVLSTVWEDTSVGGYHEARLYVVQTTARVVQRCILMTTDPGDLVLDPTCGSGTTAYVAEQWGRRWITIDTSRVAIALARTRLMAAKFPYYLLADSPEGQKKEMEASGKILGSAGVPPAESGVSPDSSAPQSVRRDAERSPRDAGAPQKFDNDIRRGFICKRVPHVTLKSIANNPDIKEGMSREEIDAAIAKHADTELLYDQPYENNKRIRVTGPFTVESLSPHRVLSSGDGGTGVSACGEGDFVTLIIENLKKAGVQNTVKNERLKFDRLESFAGTWLHATGEYTESGKSKRVAISIGPEHGTVGPEQLKEAAKEAVKGVGFDLLVICGFAFDPHVSEEAKRYGKLAVIMARMNPDLAMGDELLKKTGAGNLFMVFGEPDMRVECGEWLVTRGGKLLMLRHEFEKLSGIAGLAEINRVGGTDLRCFQKLSEGGKLRSDVSNSTRGSVGAEQHRGGRGKGGDGRVSSIPEHGAGITGGTGDATSAGGTAGLSVGSGSQKTGENVRRDWADAERSEKIAHIQALTAADFPLVTRHSTQVTILGLDVYDPTTGQIRNNTTDDIACWFIDTNYNGESFFVRHAYFTGGNEPYERLKKSLRAEIDEATWSTLYSTISRPFDPPKTGKIAVKLINHYGDEVMKVHETGK